MFSRVCQVYPTWNPVAGVKVTAEVKVKVLQLGRPITCEHPFGAGAGGPADLGLADTCRRLSEGTSIRNEQVGVCRSVHAAISQTAGAIEEQGGCGGDAYPTPPRP